MELMQHQASQPLADLYAAIDQRVAAITAAQPLWPCHKGCDGCCRRLAQTPEMTAAEWHVVYNGFLHLEPAMQDHVASKIRALAQAPQPHVMCPFLDDTSGACRIYAHRPAACRMYGFYVSHEGNWWCDIIEARHADGMGEGLILGNHRAMMRQCEAQFGEVKSIVAWFEQERS